MQLGYDTDFIINMAVNVMMINMIRALTTNGTMCKMDENSKEETKGNA